MLVPKLVTTLRTYDRQQFTADLTAGVIVGIVALPLAIAFAIPSGVSSLVGEWRGEYDGGASGRSGSIVFVLRSAADTAHGDVLLIPRAYGERATADARPGQLQLRSNQVLRIAFVRVTSGEVSGTLDPYTDPDCNCSVQTTFTGRLTGNTIEGTFVTRGSQLPREQTGRWRVTRAR